MCRIAGIASLTGASIERLEHKLALMKELLAHCCPDGHGMWTTPDQVAGLAHRRLSILDLSPAGAQPMVGPNHTALVHNDEVYNDVECREELAGF